MCEHRLRLRLRLRIRIRIRLRLRLRLRVCMSFLKCAQALYVSIVFVHMLLLNCLYFVLVPDADLSPLLHSLARLSSLPIYHTI